MTYRIAAFADTHLGYAARCRSHSSGLNMRVRDGYLGLRETIDQILAAEVDAVVHGGDLFHRSHPSISDIAWARRQFERFSQAGIPVFATTGNHDFANDRGKSPATAAVHDPGRGIHMVTDPLQVFTPVDGLNIHVVSHIGLAAAERAMPQPVNGELNIFVTHGAAQVPGHEIFATVDSPGEAVIGYDVLTMPWTATLLGHYHGMGALPGFNGGDTGQAWYAGSLLRRGFSDPEGGRGWLLVTIHDDGKVTIEPRYIRQRPQFDLPFIDATGMTGGQVEELIRENLASVDINEAIVRQRVLNIPLAVRRGVDSKALADIAAPALVWQPEFLRPAETEFAASTEADAAVGSIATAGSADLPGMFTSWFGDWASRTSIAEELRPVVAENGTRLLRQVSKDVETGTSDLATPTVTTPTQATPTNNENEEIDDPFA